MGYVNEVGVRNMNSEFMRQIRLKGICSQVIKIEMNSIP
jgi:hypothetical protein